MITMINTDDYSDFFQICFYRRNRSILIAEIKVYR